MHYQREPTCASVGEDNSLGIELKHGKRKPKIHPSGWQKSPNGYPDTANDTPSLGKRINQRMKERNSPKA